MQKINNNTNKEKKIIISGYYGYGNFGDEVILRAIIDEIRQNLPNYNITVISSNTKQTKSFYSTYSVYKYDFLSIIKEIFCCNIFISGGGSLFQDITSFKSLLYYLGLLFIAKISGKRTVVFAQGIGPLKHFVSRFLVGKLLNKIDLVTVRDEASAKLLSSINVKSIVTADPVWGLEETPQKISNKDLKIGIQLRKWQNLDRAKLNMLAEMILSYFNNKNTEIYLISLQEPCDTEIMNQLKEAPAFKQAVAKVKFLFGLVPEEVISCISSMDFMIAMRYHAGLIAAKHAIPSLMLSYDPKVRNLAVETGFPCISVENISFSSLDTNIKYLLEEKKALKSKLNEVSKQKKLAAHQNIMILKDSFQS